MNEPTAPSTVPPVQPPRAPGPHRAANRRCQRSLALLLACAALGATAPAQEPQPVAPQPAAPPPPVNPYQFPDWRADFPYALEWPIPAGKVYERNRRRALEQLVENLKGGLRRDAWLLATEFFARAPDEAAEPLIAAMDRAYSNPSQNDVVENCVKAMGAMGGLRFEPAIKRALEHPSDAVRQAAYATLANCASADMIRSAFRRYTQLDGRAQASWARAARLRLGDEALPLFADLMQRASLPARDILLREVLELPPAQAAKVLDPMWSIALGEFKIIIAAQLHGAGDVRGTIHLRDLLRGSDTGLCVQALQRLGAVPPGELFEDVKRLVLSEHPAVKLEVARVLARIPGEETTKALETLANPDESFEVVGVAVRELRKRGNTRLVDTFLEEIPTATGTRLQTLMNMLSASGDPRGVELFRRRFEAAPEGEGRSFLQAIAFSNADGAFAALTALFLAPERLVTSASRTGGALTTVNYVPLLMQNLRGAEAQWLATWPQLPADDVVRRAHWLMSCSAVAADRSDPSVQQALSGLLRQVLFDRKAQSQLRLLALAQLQMKSLTLDDVFALKAAIADEDGPMQRFLNDYLTEYF